jgi:trk system potassium uptake protein TrkA
MNVIISGIGQVGYHIAVKLAQEKHEITVIDNDPLAIENITREIDLQTLLGSGASIELLEKAGIADADMFLACSSVDEVNITSCIIAKNLKKRHLKTNPSLNPLWCMARVRALEYDLNNPKVDAGIFGVDLFINQDKITCEEIIQIIDMPGAVEVIPFSDGRVELVGFSVHEDSLFKDRRLMGIREIDTFRDTLIVAIQRGDELIIPNGKTKIFQDDVLFFIGEKNIFKEISPMFTGKRKIRKKKKRIFILGGGSLTPVLINKLLLYKGIEIKVVDSDLTTIFRFSEQYPSNVTCLYGSVTDLDLLIEEGIKYADHVIAATNDEDTNIVASILCKEYGAKQTITIVQDPDYVKIKMMAGIDVAISPKILTSGEVLKKIRKGAIQKTAPLLEEGAELIEVTVPDETKKFGKPIKDLSLPAHSIIGAVVRGNDICIPDGNTLLLPRDDIIVFVLPEAKEAVENFFMSSKSSQSNR